MAIKITYFVHGTTTDNENDLATGWEPGVLSELGKKQAIELGDLTKDMNFDAVFCSDLQRAIDSSRLAFSDRFTITEDDRLREANYGDFTEKPSGTFKHNLSQYVDSQFPNGESYKDVEKRIRSFLEFLNKKYSEGHIAIVAHQAPQLALDVILKNRTWEESILEDWRHTKSWQPGWEYTLK